MKEEVKKE